MNRSEAGKLGQIKALTTQQRQKFERIQKYLKNQKKCKFCNTLIHYEFRQNEFCNRSCAAKLNNTISNKRYSIYTIRQCNCCKKEFTAVYNSKCNLNCKECIKNRVHLKKIHFLSDCKTDYSRKQYLLQIRELKCEICKNTIWNDRPIPIEMDHIDGNHENNNENNLRLICPNCHAQTNTYKSKNKGRGRQFRRTRYFLGKTY